MSSDKQLPLALKTVRQDMDMETGTMVNTVILVTPYGNEVVVSGVTPQTIATLIVDAKRYGLLEKARQEKVATDNKNFENLGNNNFAYRPSPADNEEEAESPPAPVLAPPPIKRPRQQNQNKPRVVGKDEYGYPIMSGPPLEEVTSIDVPSVSSIQTQDADEDGVPSI